MTDVLVIGAGVNGLVAAHLLARTGRRVTVLERATAIDATPAWGWMPAALAAELGVTPDVLGTQLPDPWCVVPLADGGRLELSRDVARTAAAIATVSPADGARWPAFCERMHRLARVLEALYLQPAPDVETRQPVELLRIARLGLKVRRMGRETIVDLLRVLPMSVADLLDEWFEHDALKGALGAAGVIHLHQGPRSGGTAYNFLHHHVGCAPGVFRPPLTTAARALAGRPGISVRHGAVVSRILVREGRVRGVALAGGEEIAASLVVSDADPRATLLGMLEPGWLDPELMRAVRNIKCRGVAARVTLTLDRPAEPVTLTVAPSLEALERAYDAVKYGRMSAQPWVEARADGHALHVHAQYAPYALEGGWTDEARRAFGEAVVARLAEHVPGLRGQVRQLEVLTPVDLEARSGLTEGQAYHGEQTLDQVLFMRPVPGWSRYRTPIGGLWLCGAGTHPGGQVAGVSGRLAARAILEDAGR